MNWDLLSAWIYENDQLDISTALKHKIGCVYADPRSSNAASTTGLLRSCKLVPGIYYCTSDDWYPGETPKQHAKRVSDYVQHAGIITHGEPLMLDVEEKPIAWTTEFLKAVHSYLPSRPTSLTVGPGQDSSVVPVQTLRTFGWHLYVQLYDGQMGAAPAFQVWPALFDLMAKGMPKSSLHPFYAAGAVPWNATDGAIFVLENLS